MRGDAVEQRVEHQHLGQAVGARARGPSPSRPRGGSGRSGGRASQEPRRAPWLLERLEGVGRAGRLEAAGGRPARREPPGSRGPSACSTRAAGLTRRSTAVAVAAARRAPTARARRGRPRRHRRREEVGARGQRPARSSSRTAARSRRRSRLRTTARADARDGANAIAGVAGSAAVARSQRRPPGGRGDRAPERVEAWPDRVTRQTVHDEPRQRGPLGRWLAPAVRRPRARRQAESRWRPLPAGAHDGPAGPGRHAVSEAVALARLRLFGWYVRFTAWPPGVRRTGG